MLSGFDKNKLEKKKKQNLKNKTDSGRFSIELLDRMCQKPWCDQAEPKTVHYFYPVSTKDPQLCLSEQ